METEEVEVLGNERRRDRHGRIVVDAAQRRRLLEAYDRSGQSQQDFAPAEEPTLLLNGVAVCHPGNLSAIVSAPKRFKSVSVRSNTPTNSRSHADSSIKNHRD